MFTPPKITAADVLEQIKGLLETFEEEPLTEYQRIAVLGTILGMGLVDEA